MIIYKCPCIICDIFGLVNSLSTIHGLPLLQPTHVQRRTKHKTQKVKHVATCQIRV